MTRDEYLELMEFPEEWISLGMLPVDLIDQLIAGYVPGNEMASEHDRNGVFHWWLEQSPDRGVLAKLIRLSLVDPDQIMATDVRRHILASAHADDELRSLANK